MSDAPEILKLRQLLSDLPEFLSWQQLWDLRTETGELMRGANPETRSILKVIYDKFTVQLKERAEELGKGDEFAEAERSTQLLNESENIIGQLKDTENGIKFFDVLSDPAKGNELAALDRLMESSVGTKNYVNQARDSAQATYRVAKSARAGESFRFRDLLGFALEWFKLKVKRSGK